MMIEELSETDLNSLGPLLDEFASAHKILEFRPDYHEHFRNYLKTIIRDPDAVSFIVKNHDAIVGMMAGQIQENGPVILPERIGYIRTTIVLSKYRRDGIGMRLWGEMRRWFAGNGINEIQLCTTIENLEARGFWECCGFSVVMERRRQRIKR